MYQAVRVFSAAMNSANLQWFYTLVFLPRLRDDIAEFKRLNYHLYQVQFVLGVLMSDKFVQALCRSLWKPRAFLKGILLKWLMTGDGTYREAVCVLCCSFLERKDVLCR